MSIDTDALIVLTLLVALLGWLFWRSHRSDDRKRDDDDSDFPPGGYGL